MRLTKNVGDIDNRKTNMMGMEFRKTQCILAR